MASSLTKVHAHGQLSYIKAFVACIVHVHFIRGVKQRLYMYILSPTLHKLYSFFCLDVGDMLLSAVTSACNALISSEQQLNQFDTQAGDGDCGSTLKLGAKGKTAAATVAT